MKKLLIVFAILFMISTKCLANYADAWREGYKDGYKNESGSTLPVLSPILPLAPLPELGKSSEKDGYLAGVEAGRERYREIF